MVQVIGSYDCSSIIRQRFLTFGRNGTLWSKAVLRTCHVMDALLWVPMKVVTSSEMLRVGACSHGSSDYLMGLPNKLRFVIPVMVWEPAERKHLSRRRKRKQ